MRPVARAGSVRAATPRRGNRQRQRTRAALLVAGRRLLAARSVDALSVDQIVAAAEVAKGSFYNHFADKDRFAREIGAAVRKEAELAVVAANQGCSDPAERLARALAVFMRFAVERPESAQVLWRLNSGATMADAPINQELRAELARASRDRDFALADVETGVLMVMGTVIISIRHVLEERLTTPVGELAVRMGASMLRSLGVPVRRARAAAQRAARSVLSG